MTSDDHAHVLMALGNLMTESQRLVVDRDEDGLRLSQHRVIGHVPPGGITVTDLAVRVGMTKQGTGQFVTQLTESGHLQVSRTPQDARVRLVSRTAQGEAAARRLAGLLEGLEAQWAARVGSGRYAQFRAVLDDLAGSP